MAPACCGCRDANRGGAAADGGRSSLPLICLVPREDAHHQKHAGGSKHRPASATTGGQRGGPILLDENYIREQFKLPKRALYLDPFRRPLITFPMSQEASKNFSMARKTKINQQILDGFFDPSEAISAPSVFPYAAESEKKQKGSAENEEIIYILQLPDWEYTCPTHNQTIKTPRFIWHSCKKQKTEKGSEPTRGGGPMNKPKPWLLSRHTDFDLMSQW